MARPAWKQLPIAVLRLGLRINRVLAKEKFKTLGELNTYYLNSGDFSLDGITNHQQAQIAEALSAYRDDHPGLGWTDDNYWEIG